MEKSIPTRWAYMAVYAFFGFTQTYAQCTGPDSMAISQPHCVNTSITFTDISATDPITSTWKFGDGTQLTLPGNANTATHTYAAPGTYTVTLVGEYAACTDSISTTLTVDAFPTAAFTYLQPNACGGLPITFQNTSTGAVSYVWNFGDTASGNMDTSTLANPQHVFSPVGTGQQTYTVTLTATSANGCTAQTTQTITVTQIPDASLEDVSGNNFSGCDVNNLPLTVSNASTTLADNVHYHINWGNGAPDFDGATFNTASTVYNSQGMFPITFTVTGNNGCTATQVYNAFNGSNPSIGLSTPGSTIGLCGPITIQFPLSNFENNPPGTTYTILTNDGSPTVVYNHPPPALITHTFNGASCGYTGLGGSPNSFYLRVIASNPCGESMVTVEPIRVSEKPEVNFTSPTTACTNLAYTFGAQLVDGTSVSNQGVCNSTLSQLNFRYWEISPSTGWTSTSNLQNSNTANVTFLQPGTYTVTFIGGTACGRDTMVKTICVTGPPTPNFAISTETGCAPLNVNTQNLTPTPICNAPTSLWAVTPLQSVCEPVFPQWQFDSGTTAQSAQPIVKFQSPGTYRVALTMSHACGNVTRADTVTVKAPPVLTLAPLASACGSQTISPQLSTNACLGSNVLTYAWSFPGGTPGTSTAASPGTIFYDAPGTYTVTASATNECGSTDTTRTFTVHPIPQANAGTDVSVCPGDTAEIGSPSAGLQYAWSPSQYLTDAGAPQTGVVGNNSTSGNLIQTYVLSVSDSNCTGTDTVSVTVYPAPAAPVAQNDSLCAGEQATLGALANGSVLWYNTPADGTPIHTGSTYITPVLYSTQTYYTEHNNGTCTSPVRTAVTATVYPLPATQTGPDLTLCNQPTGTQLTATPPGGTWTGTYVTASGLFTPTQTGSFANTYTYTNANGCTQADTLWVTVIDPTPTQTQGDTTVCAGGPAFSLQATPAGGTWSGGPVNPAGLFNPGTPGAYTLYYTFGTGSCAVQDTLQVTVIDQPVVEAGASIALCADAPAFTLTGYSPGGGTWSGPGVTDTSGIVNPQLLPPGTHTLTYTVYGSNGCPASDSRTLTVYALPNVNVGPDIQLCNQATPVQLTATPAGGVWIGSNISPTGMYTPADTGVFTVAYTYTNTNNCTQTDSLGIIVIEPPTVTTPDVTTVCQNSATFLLYASPSGGTWAGFNITLAGWFSPTVPGTFNLVYTLGSGTCQVNDTAMVVVNPLPEVQAGADIVVCGSAAPFALTGASPTGGFWGGLGITDANAGIFSPAVAGVGTWTVSYMFSDINTCFNWDDRTIQVLPPPSASFTADTLACTGTEMLFTNTSGSNLSNLWSFGDGAQSAMVNPYHTYTTEGYYNVQLVVSSGPACTDTVTQTIHIIGSPQAGIVTTPAQGCGPLTVDLSATPVEPGFTYLWNLGNGNTSMLPAPNNVVYPAPAAADTVYQVALNVSNTCGSAQATQTITVFAEPQAIMGSNVNTGCSPLPVEFTQLSTGGVSSVFWNFGDGSTSTSLTPGAHTFVTGPNDTVYTVMLAIQTACGPDTAYMDIHVLPNTVNAFFNTNPLQGCPPLEVDFTNYSSGGTVTEWTFGDGNVSNQSSPTHVYQIPGTYTASLVVNNGCSFDTAQVTLTVFDFPSLNFTAPANALCQNQTVTFTNTSGNVSNTSWTFGDGGTSNAYSPTHTYNTAGTFLVSLTGTSLSYGCTGTVSATVTVNPSPQLAIGFPQGQFCAPYTATFPNNSTQTDYYTWDFGDGNTAAGPNPTHTYTQEGTHTVTVIGEHVAGCKDTATGTVQILPSPVAAFTLPETGCVPVEWVLQNQTTGAISYLWNLGNGTSSTLNEPSVNYTEAGFYAISLAASNAYGCTDTVEHYAVLYDRPIAALGEPLAACAGTPIQFVNPSSNGMEHLWLFGDGTTSVLYQPQNVYEIPGKYSITLIASNPGCSDTVHVPDFVTIYPIPEASFSLSPDTINTVEPVLQLIAEQDAGNNCAYYLPDGSVINQCKAQVLLTGITPGEHSIMLVVANPFGCLDSTWRTLYAIDGSTLFVPNSFTPNADGENDVFYAYSTGLKSFEMTIFDRWGNILFKADNIKQGWNGHNKTGQTVKQDVYVWQINARDLRDEPIKRNGRVTVIY